MSLTLYCSVQQKLNNFLPSQCLVRLRIVCCVGLFTWVCVWVRDRESVYIYSHFRHCDNKYFPCVIFARRCFSNAFPFFCHSNAEDKRYQRRRIRFLFEFALIKFHASYYDRMHFVYRICWKSLDWKCWCPKILVSLAYFGIAIFVLALNFMLKEAIAKA